MSFLAEAEEAVQASTVSCFHVLLAHTLDVHVPTFFMSVAGSLEMPLVTLLARRFHLSTTHIAQFVALASFSRAAVDIPCGVLLTFTGLRAVILVSVLLNAFAAVVGWYASGVVSLVVFCSLSGCSLGCYFLCRHIFVAKVVSRRYRGSFMSTITGVMRWAHVLGPLIGGGIIHYTKDARDAMLLSAFAAGLSAVSLMISFWSEEWDSVHSNTSSGVSTKWSADEEERLLAGEATVSPTALAPSSSHTAAVIVSPPHEDDDVNEEEPDGAVDPAARSPQGEQRKKRERKVKLTSAQLNAVESLDFLPTEKCCSDHYMTTHLPPHPPESGGFAAFVLTVQQQWRIIFLLGVYVMFFTALRANRKLMIVIAGMHTEMSDSQITFLLSTGFSVDAVLFPLGGIIMDKCGRQWAMLPVVLGFAVAFFALPFATTPPLLFSASCLFGLADSLGCGLIMTLVADRAPRLNAPFFGVMRTLEDIGHVLGAMSAGWILRVAPFSYTCWLFGLCALFIALWGVFVIPKEVDDDEECKSLVYEEGRAVMTPRTLRDVTQERPIGASPPTTFPSTTRPAAYGTS